MRDWMHPRPTMRFIAETVAAEYGLTVAEMKVRRRPRAVAWPRQEAMAKMLAAGFSSTQAARFFDLTDHTTALHAKKAVALRSLAQQEAA